MPPGAVCGEPPGQLSGDVCCLFAERGGTRPSREQLCRSRREWPLGRHLGEEEMLSPEPIGLDTEGKALTGEAGSL